MLHLDYETRSPVNLKTEGVYRYAQHPNTEILCMGYAFGDEEPSVWEPGEPFPARVLDWFKTGEKRSIAAHNAAFDRLITEWVLTEYDIEGLVVPPLESWYCTASQARSRGYPGALADLGRCLAYVMGDGDLAHLTAKDKRGTELIRLLSIGPDYKADYFEDDALAEEMRLYCAQDVRVERYCASLTLPLTDYEFDQYVVSEHVNDRGLMVDVEFAEAATRYAAQETKEISTKLSEITDGIVETPRQFARIKEWVKPQLPRNLKQLMVKKYYDRRKKEKVRKESLDKTVRFNILQAAEDNRDLLTPDVRDFLQLVDDAGRTSISKYRAMVDRADADEGRVRGAYMFAGAGQTGRFSSHGLQVHNFPRNCAKQPDIVRRNALNGADMAPVMSTLSSMLRPSIVARPGYSFVCGDWSAIEARALPWLADDPRADKVLDVFRECDADPDADDIYVRQAATFGGTRQEGKVAVLSLGYGGGVGAFQAMARNYGLSIPEDKAEAIKRRWREHNRWATDFWDALDTAMTKGASVDVYSESIGGMRASAGRVRYAWLHGTLSLAAAAVDDRGLTLKGTRVCTLPSGRILTYPNVEIALKRYRHDHRWQPSKSNETHIYSCIKGGWKPAVGEDWPTFDLWYGILAENITQATCADLLRECMVRVDRHPDLKGYLVGHTHDELLLEVPDSEIEVAQRALKSEMETAPAWAEGLPLKAELWVGKRYRK